VAIAEERSLSAAAQRVNVAQPSLSQHVIALEGELHVQLLERSPRGVTLTGPGEVLLSHAREIIAAMDYAKEAVRQSGSEPQGDVAFGLPSSIASVLSVPLAETIRLELPKVRLRAIDAMSGFIKTWLEEQSIDLGMLYDLNAVGHLKHRSLMTEELHFFSAPDAWPFKSVAGSPVRLADLAHVELVLPSQHHGLRIMIDRIIRSHGVVLDIATEMDGLSQIKTLVSRGSGYTILAPAAAIDFVDRGQLIMAPIVEPRLVRPVYMVRNPAKPVTRASLEVERISLEVIHDLVTRGIWQALDKPESGAG
jgi:LysR family nitrogen assimilation transcriptional regulator